jgi:hypothetical protein
MVTKGKYSDNEAHEDACKYEKKDIVGRTVHAKQQTLQRRLMQQKVTEIIHMRRTGERLDEIIDFYLRTIQIA